MKNYNKKREKINEAPEELNYVDDNLSKLKNENAKLKEENETLNSRQIDLLFELNYSKQTELIEYIRNLYESLESKDIKKLQKKELLMNLKDSLEEFARINRISL